MKKRLEDSHSKDKVLDARLKIASLAVTSLSSVSSVTADHFTTLAEAIEDFVRGPDDQA